MNIKNEQNFKNSMPEKIKEKKIQLQLINKINQSNFIDQHQNPNSLFLKIINFLFLKKVLSSKITNRLTQKNFKFFTIRSETNSQKKSVLNPALCDKNYHNTLFLNSIHELLT